MCNTLDTSRISWIDMAKGYGTILVIYAHLGVGSLWTWIYSFHMPLFFFLSGYVFSTKYDFKDFLFKKVKSIIIPYFIYGTIMITYDVIFNIIRAGLPYSSADIIYRIKLLVFQERFWTLWFIACLFFLNLIFYLLVKLIRNHWGLLLISLACPIVGLYYYDAGGTPLYWNIDACLMAIPFFACGYLYKLYCEKIDNLLVNNKRSIFAFLFVGLINIIAWRLSLDSNGLGLEMFACNYGNPIFTYVAAFAGTICVVIASKWFTLKPILYIGENSMIYYALHQTVMIPVMYKILSRIGIDALMTHGYIGVVLYKWICVAGIVCALSIFNYIIKKFQFNYLTNK